MNIQTSEGFLSAVTALAERSNTTLVGIQFLEPGLMLAWERDDQGYPMGPCLFFDQSMWQVKPTTCYDDADIDIALRAQAGMPIGSLFADELKVDSFEEAAEWANDNIEPSRSFVIELALETRV